jgi:WD40 repeat protein/serine/threonine protein kinase
MSVVYEAEQVSLGRRVALKVMLHRQLDARLKARFEREARAVARLHHTNIVPVFGVGDHEGLPYYVMQLIQGRGLDRLLQRLCQQQQAVEDTRRGGANRPGQRVAEELLFSLDSGVSLDTGPYKLPGEADQAPPDPGPNTKSDGKAASAVPDWSLDPACLSSHSSSPGKTTYWRQVAAIGAQAAGALAYAHRQGVLHRDIKPSNLLLDERGTVWIADFGLAKIEDQENLTQTGDVLGTLRYMPPEAFEGKGDGRGDLYALGLTLYELLALRPAFDEKDRNKLLKQVTSAEPVRLERVNPRIPRDLATIVHKAIEREPEQRYSTADELAADLERFVRDEPIKARRVSNLERLGRWARHNRGLAATLLALLVLLVVVAIGSSVAALLFQDSAARQAELAARATKAQQEAEDAASEARRREAAERWQAYRANIAAASSALQLNNVAAASRALDDAPEEHRNWEWRHFHAQLDVASRVIAIHPPVLYARSGMFALNDTVVASQKAKGKLGLWDWRTGAEVAEYPAEGFIHFIALSPDGKRVAVEAYGAVLSWDGATGQRIFHSQPAGGLASFTFSPDLRHYAATQPDNTARVWDLVTGKVVLDLPKPYSDEQPREAFSFVSFAFSPDGPRLAYSPNDNTIRLWDLAAKKEITPIRGLTSMVTALAISPDGKKLALGTAFPDSKALVLDLDSGKSAWPLGHRNRIESLAFSGRSDRLLTTSLDKTARVWDARSGSLIAQLRGHAGSVWDGAFTPDGTRVLTASEDQSLRVWDAAGGDLLEVLRGHHGPVVRAAVSRDGRMAVSGSMDATLRLWDLESTLRAGLLRGHAGFVYDVAFNPKRPQAASVSWDKTVRLWDLETGRPTGVLPIADLGIALAYDPAGERLAALRNGHEVVIFDVARQKRLHSLAMPTREWFIDPRLAFDPAGKLLAVASKDGRIHLWDPERGVALGHLVGHEQGSAGSNGVSDVAFSPDGGRLASCGMDGRVRLWDLPRRKEVTVLKGHEGRVNRLAWSSDGRVLASSSDDKTVRIWDVAEGRAVAVLKHGGIVYGLSIHPDGTRLAAACVDNTIRLWDLSGYTEVAELRGHGDYVHAVMFSPDGTRLLSGSGDQTVRVWDSMSLQARGGR